MLKSNSPKFWTLLTLHDFCKEEEKVLEYLKEKGLLKKQMFCPNCGWEMRICGRNWRCSKTIKTKKGKKRCNKKISIRKGTWFDKTKLGFGDVLKLTYMIIHNQEQQTIAQELNLNKNTVLQWSIFLKEVLIEWLKTQSEPLGGPGKIVEVYESKFGKRKCNKGQILDGQLVFGGIERGANKIFLTLAENKSSQTVIKIIKEWIAPGSKVLSDCWKGYKNLDKKGYEHLTVNYSITFIDKETNARTNEVEGAWEHTQNFWPSYGRKKKNFVGYLAHFYFNNLLKKKNKDLFELVLDEISRISFDEKVDYLDKGESEGESESELKVNVKIRTK